MVLFYNAELKVKNKIEHQAYNTVPVPSTIGNIAGQNIKPSCVDFSYCWSNLEG